MKMKKLLSAIIAGAMLLSSVSVFAQEQEAPELPSYGYDILDESKLLIEADSMDSNVTKNYKLDFGMTFIAEEEVGDITDKPYKNWKADFAIEFSNDTTAVLAGQYAAANNGKWLALDRYDFEADTPVYIMNTLHEISGNDIFDLTYEDVLVLVREFNCGLKFDNATEEGTEVTLSICLTDPATDETYVLDGYSFTYTPAEVELPGFEIGDVEDLNVKAEGLTSGHYEYTLDMGMYFEATEALADALNKPYINWIADFEIQFSEDTKATLLGQYDFIDPEAWVTLGSYDFEANEPLYIMETLYELSGNNELFKITYEDALVLVKKFNCGVVFDDATPFGTEVTLKLRLMNPETGDDYVLGEYDFVYESHKATDTNETIVENLNKLSAGRVEANADEIKDTIVELDQESKDNINAEVIKSLVGNVVDETATEPAAYATDSTISVTVEVPDASADIPASLDGAAPFEVTVEENGVPVNEVDVPVLIAIPIDPNAEIEKIVHIHKGVVKEITNYHIEGNMLYIQMSEFSYFGIFYASTIATGEAVLKLVEVTDAARVEKGKAKFDLVLEGDAVDTVKNYVAGEFDVAVSGNSASFKYDIEVNYPDETTIRYTDTADGRKYNMYLKGTDVASGVITGFDKVNSWTANIADAKLVLGTLTVASYGTGSIQLSNPLMMKHDGSVENLAAEITTSVGNAAHFDVEVPTQELTINVKFNNKIENVDPAYNAMTLSIVGGDVDESFELGENVQGVVFADDTYTVQIDLPENEEYKVTVEGAGYRTADYFVTMRNSAKTLNFWNNVKDAGFEAEVEVGLASSKEASNFVAGDIIEDNIINIYDLSAVVSYFGEEGLSASVNPDYAQYDLNRDGKIDSKDVAYVLVSWGK